MLRLIVIIRAFHRSKKVPHYYITWSDILYVDSAMTVEVNMAF